MEVWYAVKVYRTLNKIALPEGDLRILPVAALHYINEDFEDQRTTDQVIRAIEIITLPLMPSAV